MIPYALDKPLFSGVGGHHGGGRETQIIIVKELARAGLDFTALCHCSEDLLVCQRETFLYVPYNLWF